MRYRGWVVVVSVTVLSAGVAFGQLLPQASDDVKLQVTKQAFDADAAGQAQKTHAEALAKQFNIEPHVVENLRTSKQGWGEIAIRMGLAQELVKIDPKTYPTMTEALQKVGDLREQGAGWGAIAKDLGFKLGLVVNDVQRARNEMRAEANKSATEGVVTQGKAMERAEADKAAKSDRAEQAPRPDPAEKPQRPERPERPQRPERPEKPERPGK